MKSVRLAVLPAVFAMLSVVPASADIIDYTFTAGVAFNTSTPSAAINKIACDATDGTDINLNCTAVNLTGAPGQSITSPGSLYYYIGSVQANEAGGSPAGITATEAAEPHNFLITFSIGGDTTQSFSIAVPVTAVPGNFPSGSFTFGQASQIVDLGDGNYLTARLWFNDTLPGGINTTNFIIGSTLADKDTSFTWTSGNATAQLFLQMEYNTPEPASFVLMGSALLLGLAVSRWRKRA